MVVFLYVYSWRLYGLKVGNKDVAGAVTVIDTGQIWLGMLNNDYKRDIITNL